MFKYAFFCMVLLSACYSNTDDEVATATPEQDTAVATILPAVENTAIDDNNFLTFWKQFKTVLKNKNQKTFQSLSLDSLNCGTDTDFRFAATNTVLFEKLLAFNLKNKWSDTGVVELKDVIVQPEFAPAYLLQQLKAGKTKTKEVVIELSATGDEPIELSLKFIETKDGYRFYGYNKE